MVSSSISSVELPSSATRIFVSLLILKYSNPSSDVGFSNANSIIIDSVSNMM